MSGGKLEAEAQPQPAGSDGPVSDDAPPGGGTSNRVLAWDRTQGTQVRGSPGLRGQSQGGPLPDFYAEGLCSSYVCI